MNLSLCSTVGTYECLSRMRSYVSLRFVGTKCECFDCEESVSSRSVSWLVSRLVGQSVGRSVCRLLGCLVCRLVEICRVTRRSFDVSAQGSAQRLNFG